MATNSSDAHVPLQPLVHVVDDDDAMRASLLRLLRSRRIDARGYASGQAFLETATFDGPGCLLLDVKMPGIGGLDVQATLRQRGHTLPTIFLTGSADVPIAVAAMRAGAVDFIEKPFDDDHLVARITQAMQHALQTHQSGDDRRDAQRRVATLTPREREIMALVAKGLTSKEIARIVDSSHRTVEIHRRNLMDKLGTETLADLVRVELLLASS